MGSIKKICMYIVIIFIVCLAIILGDKHVVRADKNVSSENQQGNIGVNNQENVSDNTVVNDEEINEITNTTEETKEDIQQSQNQYDNVNNNEIQTNDEQMREDIYAESEVEKIPIVLKESSITLSVGETKTLFYKNVSYASSNKELVDVSKNGLVTAKKAGIASVILSNETTTQTISVFILDNNNSIIGLHEEVLISNEKIPLAGAYSNSVMDILAKKIADAVDEYVSINGDEITCVTPIALEQLYKLKKNLGIVYDGFSIDIYGEEIDSYGDGLKTNFEMIKSNKYKDSYVFSVDSKLPGRVRLKLRDRSYNKKYIYVYNKNAKQYKLLSENNKKYIELKNNEKYLITDIDLDKYVIDEKVIIAILAVIGVLMVIYVVIKKRYWFW